MSLPISLQSKVAARSLLIQSCWNYEGMQNVGFAFALAPWLKTIERRGGPPAEAGLQRHLEFFNTQPYMAAFVLGVSGRLEEELAEAPEEARPQLAARISRLKGAFGSALAGIGDALFWGTLRPVCASLGIALWLLAYTLGSESPAAWAAGGYLLAYNLPALWLRWKGLSMGYRMGEGLAVELKHFRWQEKIKVIRWIGLVLAAAVAASALLVAPWAPAASLWNVVLLAAAIAVRRLGYPTPRVYAASVALCILAAAAGLV